MSYEHIPVLLKEAIEYLSPKLGENFIDATLGGGGYSRQILQRIGPGGRLLSIDLDTNAIDNSKLQITKLNIQNWQLAHGNFSHLDTLIKNHNFPSPNGIVADLGLSSYLLDDAKIGISFQKNELLDMRFDQSQSEEDAKYILNHKSLEELTEIFRGYGEEKYSFQIAKNIVNSRTENLINYTSELYAIIEDSLPKPVKHTAASSARRIFQALRIAVNHELENLKTFLPKALDILSPGGRLVIVAFHSLEDRIVKDFFLDAAKGCICPIDFPICLCGRTPMAKILTKKPVVADGEESVENSRSRSAKLRAIVKL